MTTNRGAVGRSNWRVATGVAAALSVAALAAPAAATLPVTHAEPASRLSTTTAPAPAVEAPFVPEDDKPETLPTSLADGVAALSRPTPADRWQAAWNRQGLSIREIIRAAARERVLLPITAAGIVMIVIASFARRRHRRQIGWGMLPERPVRREHDEF